MPKFTFALPNGKFFELVGPEGSTQAQAEKIFLEQMASGALVGLRSGDTIESPTTRIEKFGLDRLDRGTAGVRDVPLLSITNNGVISVLPVLSTVQVSNGINTADYVATRTVNNAIGPLTPAQVQSLVAQSAKSANQAADQLTGEGIGKYKFSSQQMERAGYTKPGTSCRFLGIKNVNEYQQPDPALFVSVMSSPNVWTGKDGITDVDKLLANETLQDKIQEQLIRDSYNQLLNQGEIQVPTNTTVPLKGTVLSSTGSSTVASVLAGSLGVGVLGNLGSLIPGGVGSLGGLLSAGTAKISQFNLSSVFSSSSSSNTLPGIGSLTTLASTALNNLSNLNIASAISNTVGGVSDLAGRGISQLGGLLENASRVGVSTATQWAKGLTPDPLSSQLNSLSKSAQYAVNFSDFKLPTVASLVAPAAAFSGTINRNTVDSATSRLIGSNKVPTPSFAPPFPMPTNFNALSPAINTAGALLNSVSLPGGLVATANNILNGRLPGLPAGLNNVSGELLTATPGFSGSIGGLTAGASLSNFTGTATTDPNGPNSTVNPVVIAERRKTAITESERINAEADALTSQIQIALDNFNSGGKTPELYAEYKRLSDLQTALRRQALTVLESVA